MMTTCTCLWVTILITSQVLLEAIIIRRPTEIFRRYREDNLYLEWDILFNNYKPFTGETYLHLKKGETLLYLVYLQNQNFNFTEMNNLNQEVGFSNSKFSIYGFVILGVELEDAGEYSCSYSEGGVGSTEHSKSVITLFVYDAPETPVIRPSGPIVAGNDINLECVTRSHSEPHDHRPGLDITWYKDGGPLTREQADTMSDVAIVGDSVRLTNLEGNRVHYYNCSVQEKGSNIIKCSSGFPVLLLVVEPVTRDIEDAKNGDNVQLIWRLYPESPIPIMYNRTIHFIRDQEEFASFNMRYFYWKSNLDRVTHYNHVTGEHGFTIHDVLPEDIGHYSCAYRDEFGTDVLSKMISVRLEGYTLAPPMTMNVMVEPYSDSDTDGLSAPQDGSGSKGGSPPVTDSNVTGILIGAVTGAVLLVLIILISIFIVKKRRKIKEPSSLVRKREPEEDVVRYTGSTHSIYNTLRESLMVSDDVMNAISPSVPPRDDTYDQPFAETRTGYEKMGNPECGQVESAYLTPIGLSEPAPVSGARYSNTNTEGEKLKSCDNQLTNRNQEQNLYLMPISTRPKENESPHKQV